MDDLPYFQKANESRLKEDWWAVSLNRFEEKANRVLRLFKLPSSKPVRETITPSSVQGSAGNQDPLCGPSWVVSTAQSAPTRGCTNTPTLIVYGGVLFGLDANDLPPGFTSTRPRPRPPQDLRCCNLNRLSASPRGTCASTRRSAARSSRAWARAADPSSWQRCPPPFSCAAGAAAARGRGRWRRRNSSSSCWSSGSNSKARHRRRAGPAARGGARRRPPSPPAPSRPRGFVSSAARLCTRDSA